MKHRAGRGTTIAKSPWLFEVGQGKFSTIRTTTKNEYENYHPTARFSCRRGKRVQKQQLRQ
jgi:hypothetical protein